MNLFIFVSFCLNFKKTLHKINLFGRNKTVNSQDAMQEVSSTGKFFWFCDQSSGQPPYDQNTAFYLPAFPFSIIQCL